MPDHAPASIGARRSEAKEEHWSKVLDEWKKSGQSAAAFCRERQLPESKFWFWKREIRRRRATRSSRSPRPMPARMVPVRIVQEASRQPSPIELVFSSGMSVRLSAGFDASALCQLLAALGIKV